ncbi:hypothetical protein [Melissospora conviva]|uniref:hypothetical protein n=1 Tax=Melissospora conviva TaxID=3388432 RepID=UPI003C1949D4
MTSTAIARHATGSTEDLRSAPEAPMDQPDPYTALQHSIGDLTEALALEATAQAARAVTIKNILAMLADMRQNTEQPHTPAYLAAVRHLYWQHTVIPSLELTAAAGFNYPAEMTAAIGHVPSGLTCDVCQQDIVRTSRSWLPPTRVRDGLLRCATCDRASQEARNRRWEAAAMRSSHVEKGPVNAPCVDWMVAARLVLAYPPIGAVDPDDKYAGFHWRAYELAQQLNQRIAGTFATHLVVPVVEASRIVESAERVVGWDLDRTWEIVVPLTDESPSLILSRLERRIREVCEQRKAEALTLFPTPAPESA